MPDWRPNGGGSAITIEPNQPVIPPCLLTVAEYLEIGEVEPGYYYSSHHRRTVHSGDTGPCPAPSG